MSVPIDRDTVRHLAKLARLKLTADEEAKFEHDLKNILDYFAALQEVKTDTHAHDVRGEALLSVFREDTEQENTNQGQGTDAFPNHKDGFLQIPPVFE